jgi:hypothetical protein
MPGGDRSGPMGMGAMTGWGAGFCTGARQTGRGDMTLWGGRRGWRNRFWATGLPGWIAADAGGGVNRWATPQPDKTILDQRVRDLKAELAAIQQRLDQLEKAG